MLSYWRPADRSSQHITTKRHKNQGGELSNFTFPVQPSVSWMTGRLGNKNQFRTSPERGSGRRQSCRPRAWKARTGCQSRAGPGPSPAEWLRDGCTPQPGSARPPSHASHTSAGCQPLSLSWGENKWVKITHCQPLSVSWVENESKSHTDRTMSWWERQCVCVCGHWCEYVGASVQVSVCNHDVGGWMWSAGVLMYVFPVLVLIDRHADFYNVPYCKLIIFYRV